MRGKPEMDRQETARKTKKRLVAIFAAGMMLMAADMFMASQRSGAGLVREEGGLYMLRPEAGESREYMSFIAEIKGRGYSFDKNVDVAFDPYEEEAAGSGKEQEKEAPSPREDAEMQLRSVTGAFNDDVTAKKVLLPEKLENGAKVTWSVERKNNAVVIGIGTVLLMAAVYKTRFSAEEKRKREETESIIRQLPEFVNRLVLLLNAGLVLSSAFEKAACETKTGPGKKEDHFYGRMKEICISSKTANGSINREFRRFAKESGVKELMRISNILSDNMSKGVDLTEKLTRESELLWIGRKKNCEEKGRLAETKLTLPLMVFLMVLMVVTVAPALMEL